MCSRLKGILRRYSHLRMKSILLAYIRAFLVLLETAFHVILLRLALIFDNSEKTSYWFRRSWGRWAGFILGIKIEFENRNAYYGPALYVSNHRSMLDPPIQARYINALFIGKAEVGNLPIISQGARMTGIILVKRERLHSRKAALDQTEKALREGKSVLVYAEGTTNTNKTTTAFKLGTFKLAAIHGIPVIPVAIEYKSKRDLWYTGGLKEHMITQTGKLKTYVKMTILPAITSDNAENLLQSVKEAIDAELLLMQQNWSEVHTN